MTPRDLRRMMTGLITIEREELEAIGAVHPGPRGTSAWEEFALNPARAVLRLSESKQQALIDHLFEGART